MKGFWTAAFFAFSIQSLAEDTSRYETTPWIRKVDFIKTNENLRIVVRAAAKTECYKDREIVRTLDKDTLKIVLRLKRSPHQIDCADTILEYEEKVYDSPLAQAPKKIWILGNEGWHKMEIKN